MNLADMLSYADIKELGRIAQTYEVHCNSHSKNELIQSILSRIGRRDLLREQLGGMKIEEIRFLNSLLYDSRETFGLEELTARVRQNYFSKEEKEAANPRETVAQFRQRGWLFTGHSQQTKYLYQMPEDLKRRFREALTQQFSETLRTTEETPPVYRDERKLAAEDLQQFLAFVGEMQVPLNQDGFLFKKHLQLLQDRFTVSEEPVAKTAWRFGYGRRYKEYPARFSFIYDYCYFQGLCRENGDLLELTEAGRRRLEEGRQVDMRELYQFWLKLYKNPVPNLYSVVHWIERLTRSWTSLASLGEAILPLIKPYYYDSPESIFEQRLIKMMIHLGLLKAGEDARLGKVVQASAMGSRLILGTYVPEEEIISLQIDKPLSRLL